MSIFAQLPTDIAKSIYLTAVRLRNEHVRIKENTVYELFEIVKELRSISRTIDIVTSDNISIHQKIVTKKYDDFTHIIYRRTCVAVINNITIIMKYKRTHYLSKNRPGNLNSRVKFDEKFDINRTDDRDSKICNSLYRYASDVIDEHHDSALIILEKDILR